MRRLIVTAALTLLAPSALAAPVAWEIDSSHASATFAVRHMMVSWVRGEFGKLSGTLMLDPADVTKSTVEATIDATTINTREPKRDAHLKSPDFFDVAKYPTLTFKSKKIMKKGDGFSLTGDLTMRGVTKEVTFEMSALSPEWKNPWGTTVIATSGTARINRKDFGLVWNKPLEKAGGMLVGDDVNITIDVELHKKVPAAK